VPIRLKQMTVYSNATRLNKPTDVVKTQKAAKTLWGTPVYAFKVPVKDVKFSKRVKGVSIYRFKPTFAGWLFT